MQDSQKQSIREKFEEFILPETYDTYQGMTFEQVEKITTFWLTLIEEELSRQREEMMEKVEGMKKEHREFECNGANNGKGCYEDWCNIETCTSKDAIECKTYNQAIEDLLKALKEKKDNLN